MIYLVIFDKKKCRNFFFSEYFFASYFYTVETLAAAHPLNFLRRHHLFVRGAQHIFRGPIFLLMGVTSSAVYTYSMSEKYDDKSINLKVSGFMYQNTLF